jgi:hypothetical protein
MQAPCQRVSCRNWPQCVVEPRGSAAQGGTYRHRLYLVVQNERPTEMLCNMAPYFDARLPELDSFDFVP